MRIEDIYPMSCNLKELIKNNPVASQLASWLNHVHQGPTIFDVFDQVEQDWRRMTRLNSIYAVMSEVGPIIILIPLAMIMGALFLWLKISVWLIWPTMFVLFILSFFPCRKINRALELRIESFRQFGDRLQSADSDIRDFLDVFAFEDVCKVYQDLERICLDIVKAEKRRLNPDVQLLQGSWGHIRPTCKVSLNVLRSEFRHLVALVSKFGLTDPDVEAHFKRAEARWLELVAQGEILTDFQI